MMHYLKSSSLLILLCWIAGCKSPYKALQPVPAAGTHAALQFKPVFEKELYRCMVNGRFLFKSFHLSGILLLKEFPDGNTRVIFQNEMGFSFFDFGWDRQENFTVYHIIPQMDKPALVRTLEKDLRLLLMKKLDTAKERHFRKDGRLYHQFPLEQGSVYYIEENNTLSGIENAGRRKTVTTITISGKETAQALPDTVLFRHHNARFIIQLHKITSHAAE